MADFVSRLAAHVAPPASIGESSCRLPPVMFIFTFYFPLSLSLLLLVFCLTKSFSPRNGPVPSAAIRAAAKDTMHAARHAECLIATEFYKILQQYKIKFHDECYQISFRDDE